MADFTVAPSRSLEDIFGDFAKRRKEAFAQDRAPLRSRRVSEIAATGRLPSGVGQAVLNQFDTDTSRGQSDIESSILPTLGQSEFSRLQQERGFEQQRQFADEEFNRNRQLAELIGRLNKPSTLSQIFQGLGAGGQFAGGVAKLFA